IACRIAARRQSPSQLLPFMEQDSSRPIQRGNRKIDVARSRLAQLRVFGRVWLDIDAGPAEIVEGLGNALLDRIAGADVDIEALILAGERPCEHDVLEILSIGDQAALRAIEGYAVDDRESQ